MRVCSFRPVHCNLSLTFSSLAVYPYLESFLNTIFEFSDKRRLTSKVNSRMAVKSDDVIGVFASPLLVLAMAVV